MQKCKANAAVSSSFTQLSKYEIISAIFLKNLAFPGAGRSLCIEREGKIESEDAILRAQWK